MRKNVDLTAGRNFKKIRKDLGILQDDLRIEGVIQNISELETGAKNVSDKVGLAILERIHQIAKEKNFTFDYDVTLDVLQGKTNIVTNDILKRLRKGINDKLLREIDNDLNKMTNDEAVKFILDVENVLCERAEKIKENSIFINQYASKLLNYELEIDIRAKAYAYIVLSYCSLKKFKEAADMAKIAENVIELSQMEKTKASYYSNMANAYYRIYKYQESLSFLKKLKNLGVYVDELFYFTLEADILAMKNKFKRAEKGYLNVLAKAEKKGDINYSVNSYSNLADVYRKTNLTDQAKIYIEKALIKINFRTDGIFKLNAYYNAMLIYNEDLEKVEELFWKALPIAINLNDIEKVNSLIKIMLDEYMQNKMYDKICKVVDTVKGMDVNSDIFGEIIKNMYAGL